MIKGNAPMPGCTLSDQAVITTAIEGLRGGQARVAARELQAAMGPKELCVVLHSMRRWYTSQNGRLAQKIITHRELLREVMEIEPESPLGAFRGFKVDKADPLAALSVGDTIQLPVTRNGGCSSWTLDRARADKFSGASKTKTGLVVQLVRGGRLVPFLAPPGRCLPWFNSLYERTMGNSHRGLEQEYAIYAPMVCVQIVKVKT